MIICGKVSRLKIDTGRNLKVDQSVGGDSLTGAGNVDWRTFAGTAMASPDGWTRETNPIMEYVCEKSYTALLDPSVKVRLVAVEGFDRPVQKNSVVTVATERARVGG